MPGAVAVMGRVSAADERPAGSFASGNAPQRPCWGGGQWARERRWSQGSGAWGRAASVIPGRAQRGEGDPGAMGHRTVGKRPMRSSALHRGAPAPGPPSLGLSASPGVTGGGSLSSQSRREETALSLPGRLQRQPFARPRHGIGRAGDIGDHGDGIRARRIDVRRALQRDAADGDQRDRPIRCFQMRMRSRPCGGKRMVFTVVG